MLEFKAEILLSIWQLYKNAMLDMDVDELLRIENNYGTITIIIQEFKRCLEELECTQVEN